MTYLRGELGRAERALNSAEEREALAARRRPLPEPPAWLIERGIGAGRLPVRVHAGGCWDARKRCTAMMASFTSTDSVCSWVPAAFSDHLRSRCSWEIATVPPSGSSACCAARRGQMGDVGVRRERQQRRRLCTGHGPTRGFGMRAVDPGQGVAQ
ncbi:DUF6233 domain-containing protein [Streptomyces sp. NBC_01443]|nr:DUF6233 domain-containing protein [Streptomyces sp. NBC_01443]MCX4633145.1 DUF6233 domain-containing protein [Streptomyces sp. NBC_01443]